MRALFNKRKEIRISSKYYLLIQHKWAKKMNTLTYGLSKKTLQILLSIFVIICGSVCIWIIYTALFSKGHKPLIFDNSVKSAIPDNRPALIKDQRKILFNSEYEKISKFGNYIDSLKQSPNGKAFIDSINNCRPKLLDSVSFIQNYYRINYKN